MNIKQMQSNINNALSKGINLYQINDNGYLIGTNIIEEDKSDTSGWRDYKSYRKNIRLMNPIKPINAIIEHSTSGSNIGGALNSGRDSGNGIPGTHFYVNKKGEIFQGASLLQRTSHINNTTHRTARLDISTQSSIGIENVRMWRKEKGWDALTVEQQATNIKLVNTLLVAFELNSKDVIAHENIQHKTKGEGQEIIDLIKDKLI